MKKNKILSLKVLTIIITFCFGFITVYGAALTALSDTMSSIKIGNLSNHEFSFITPTGVQAGETIVITFPSGFSIPAGLTFADIDLNIGGAYSGSTTLSTLPSGAIVGVVRSAANVLTFTNGSTVIDPGSVITIKIGTNATFQSQGFFQITNDGTVGNKSIGITGDFGDVGTSTVDLLSDDNVQILAIVPQSFSFSISSNTIDFGNLSTSFAKYASSTNNAGDTVDTVAHTLSIATNANAGYTITIQGQTLTSEQHPTDTISPNGPVGAVSSPGSEQFGIYATKSGGGVGVVDATYGTVSSFGYDATAATSALFATASSSTGSSEVYSLHYIANIAVLTEAGNYSASIVYVATSNF